MDIFFVNILVCVDSMNGIRSDDEGVDTRVLITSNGVEWSVGLGLEGWGEPHFPRGLNISLVVAFLENFGNS